MGGLGTLGLWLFLAVVVVVATALAVGMIWLADRVLSDSVGQENNSALSPFVTCVALVFGAVRRMKLVVRHEQIVVVPLVLGGHVADQPFGALPLLLGTDHDGRAVRVLGTDEQAVVATQALEAHPDVSLDGFDCVPEVQRAVGVRQRMGY